MEAIDGTDAIINQLQPRGGFMKYGIRFVCNGEEYVSKLMPAGNYESAQDVLNDLLMRKVITLPSLGNSDVNIVLSVELLSRQPVYIYYGDGMGISWIYSPIPVKR